MELALSNVIFSKFNNCKIKYYYEHLGQDFNRYINNNVYSNLIYLIITIQ